MKLYKINILISLLIYFVKSLKNLIYIRLFYLNIHHVFRFLLNDQLNEQIIKVLKNTIYLIIYLISMAFT